MWMFSFLTPAASRDLRAPCTSASITGAFHLFVKAAAISCLPVHASDHPGQAWLPERTSRAQWQFSDLSRQTSLLKLKVL